MADTPVKLSEETIKAELERLAPFSHEVSLPYGLSTQGPGLTRRAHDRVRLADLMARAWPRLLDLSGGSLTGQRILDVACNCGGFSIEAARSGADRVLGIDVVEHYVDQANFLKRALGCDNVDFMTLAAEDVDESLGRFETTFCFGILYHFENPVLAMKRIAAVTDRMMLIDTKLERHHPTEPYWRMNFRNPSGEEEASTALWRPTRNCQFAPTARAVEQLLDYLGFSTVIQIDPSEEGQRPFVKGTWATFIALRE